MIKIPQNNKWSQTNQSDLFGNLYYTKNIDFDEQGYLKLSSRAVSLINSETDTDFNLATSLGRYVVGNFFIPTVENPYVLTVGNTDITIIKDAGDNAPTTSNSTFGKWWNNLWNMTTSTKLWTKLPTTGAWTDTGISLTTGIAHPIAINERTNTLLIGNGNTIIQLNSSYATSTLSQLTIPADYEIIGISYNNNMIGIITRLSVSITGQNKEAKFFTWDGSASSANGSYGVGSDALVAISQYKSSFITINRLGQILYFNGGGFQELASFPPYFQDVIWGSVSDKLSIGDAITVEGELIYFNINNLITANDLTTQLEPMVGGIWCYDPEIGLYHKFSPSISHANILQATEAEVNTTTNTITLYNNTTIPTTGNPVKCTSSNITPIKAGTIYFLIKVSSTQFKLATTKENAIALIPIDLTAVSSGLNAFLALELKDYGQTKVSQTGGVVMMGNKTHSNDKILFGSKLYDSNSSNLYLHLCMSVYGFKNIGYGITSKLNSSVIEDNIQKLYLKYRPLKVNDRIIIKYKNKDVIGLPEYADCTATSNTVFTTTSYISNSYSYTGEIECEIISGAGAGQMAKVSSITENSGTYTITLAEEMEGISVSDTCSIKLDSWKVLDTITSSDTENWKEIPLAKNSKWIKFKVVLEGSETTLEELQINNEKFK